MAGYAALVPLGRWLARLAATNVALVIGGALALLALGDFARFVLGADELIGWPGFYLAWAAPWILGAWWRQRYEAGSIDEKRIGAVIALGAVGVGAVLCLGLGYSPAMIDAVPGARSNTTPPSLYTAVAAVGQVGGLMMIATFLDRIGARWRRLWDRAGELSLGIYAWHLTALSLCGAVIAAGFPTPERLTTVWWVTRPLWFAAVLGVATLFVLATAGVRARLRRRSRAATAPPPYQVAAGVVFAVGGGAMVGLRGPRTLTLAVECAALFVAAWLLLRPRAIAESGGSSTPARTTPPPRRPA